MPSPDLKAIGEKMAVATKIFVARAVAPLSARLNAIEARTGTEVSAPTNARIDALLSRTATLETRLAAVTMMLPGARGKAGEDVSEFVGMIEALQVRIQALEDRLPLGYAGTWVSGQQSNKGFFYTWSGSVWYCRETTQDRPGTSNAFQLAVKKGRAAPEAKVYTVR